jgi:hypothetical protein
LKSPASGTVFMVLQKQPVEFIGAFFLVLTVGMTVIEPGVAAPPRALPACPNSAGRASLCNEASSFAANIPHPACSQTKQIRLRFATILRGKIGAAPLDALAKSDAVLLRSRWMIFSLAKRGGPGLTAQKLAIPDL